MELSRGQNLDVQKERIREFIEINGPSLPIHISNHLRLDSLLSSAFLSDLLADKELKISCMRVGNSPLYFMHGQEFQLEKYANYLPGKEREAFYLLKEHGVLQDNFMLPAIRVALRSIKDFAFPFEFNGGLYWRYIKINEQMALEMAEDGRANFKQISQAYVSSVSPINIQPVNNSVLEAPRIEIIEKKHEVVEPEIVIKKQEIVQPVKVEEKKVENIFEKPIEKEVVKEIIEEVKIRKPRVQKIPDFIVKVREFLAKDNISVVNEIKKGKKEYMAVVSVSNNGSSVEYLCIAKEKKSVSDKELMKQLQLGQKKNLPVLFLTSGEASKKAVEWMDYLGNLIVYKKLE